MGQDISDWAMPCDFRPLCIGWPIRGLGKIRHDQWIPGQILPHFDPSYVSVRQLTRKLAFSASHWSANKRARKNLTSPVDSWLNSTPI